MASKNPYDTVFWNDLEGDEHLKTCSLAAKGLWTCHLLPAAARSPERGVIIIGSWPSKVDGDLPMALSNSVGGSPDVIAVLLGELVNSGAGSIDGQGRLFNRRMVRARKLSEARSKAGKTGATSRWADNLDDGKPIANTMANTVAKSLAPKHGQPIERDAHSDTEPLEGTCDHDSKPMPSSSFLLQDSMNRENLTVETYTAPSGDGAGERGEPDDGSMAGSRKARAEARGTRLPDGWQPSPEAERFARDLGLDPPTITAEFGDHWRAVPGARGRKLDWNATYRNRCRVVAGRRHLNGAKPHNAGQARSGNSAANKAAFGAALSRLGRQGPAGDRDRGQVETGDLGDTGFQNLAGDLEGGEDGD